MDFPEYPTHKLVFQKDNHEFEVFREYTDCLYSSYGTKWNGNAVAYNGSLFVVQDRRIRRLSPLETGRLKGFPDNYTNVEGAKKTNRYQGTGNSWAVPVVKWIGERLILENAEQIDINENDLSLSNHITKINDSELFFDFGKEVVSLANGTAIPEKCSFKSMIDIVSPDAPEDIYISPVGCSGIIRRKMERNIKINPRLEEILLSISSQMTPEEIKKRSHIQKRGRFSMQNKVNLPMIEKFVLDIV